MPVLTAADETTYMNNNVIGNADDVCKVGKCAGDTSLIAPTDFIDANILTYIVEPCQAVVFYLNFSFNK